jgi:hypothetical protein
MLMSRDKKERDMKRDISLLRAGLILSLATLLYASPLFAGSAELTWQKPTTDANGDPLPTFSGYKIYYGTSSRTGNTPPGGYPDSVTITDPDQLTYTFTNLPDGHTYYFSVTAYNGAGEGSFSNEGSKAICSNADARIVNRGYYSTAQGVYDAMYNNETAQMHAVNFTENLLMDDNKRVKLQGGFVCDYSSSPGFTNISGSVTVRAGTVTMEDIVIR